MIEGWILTVYMASATFSYTLPEYGTQDKCIAAAHATARVLNREKPTEPYVISCRDISPDENGRQHFDTFVIANRVDLDRRGWLMKALRGDD